MGGGAAVNYEEPGDLLACLSDFGSEEMKSAGKDHAGLACLDLTLWAISGSGRLSKL